MTRVRPETIAFTGMNKANARRRAVRPDVTIHLC